MIYLKCSSTSCNFVAGISSQGLVEIEALIGPNSEWYPDKYPCPKCGASCVLQKTCPPAAGSITYLSAQEAFCAFSGAGLPVEQECGFSYVEKVLRTKRIVSVAGRQVRGTKHCLIDSLLLEDGTILFLSASAHGACVYKVQGSAAFTEAMDD